MEGVKNDRRSAERILDTCNYHLSNLGKEAEVLHRSHGLGAAFRGEVALLGQLARRLAQRLGAEGSVETLGHSWTVHEYLYIVR